MATFNNVLSGTEGRRLTVQGLVINISKVIGSIFPRIEVILSSTDNNVHDQLRLKVWNEKRELLQSIQPGQIITVYAINEVQHNTRTLTIVGYDNMRDDRKIEVITNIGELFTITEELFHHITSEQQLPVIIDAELLNIHITNCTLQVINEESEEEADI